MGAWLKSKVESRKSKGLTSCARSAGVILHPSSFILRVAAAMALSSAAIAADATLDRDARGMSVFVREPSRTPSGFLYEQPYDLPQMQPLPSGWGYRLSTEVGAVHSPDRGPRVREYGDYRDGLLVNHFGLGLERAAQYLDFTAGAVGRRDQHYRASFGRYGDFRTTFSFDQTPKLYSDQARTVFLGSRGNLTLPAGLTPGGNTGADVAAALHSAPFFELGLDRKRAGLEFEATPGADWRVYARYGQDRKKGTQAIGGASNFPGSPLVEAVEPIDYRTHDVTAGIQWSGESRQANLSYSGSLFRNAIDTLTWENPLTVGNPAVLQRTRMDLHPDNAFHNLKLDLAAALPMRGRVSGGVSLSRMTQNDALIPHTVNSGIVGGTDLANWNTVASLSQSTANARIDTHLMHLTAAFSPVQDLTLQARLRRYAEDNKTSYTSFNPLTGQLGYLGLDGANNTNVAPAFYRLPIRSIPFEHRKDNYGLEADHRILRRTNVTLGYEREDQRLEHREYGRTEEGRWRAALSNRDFERATVRVSYEHARRTGDNYNFNPNALYYSNAGNVPATLAQLRKYDIADRTQQVLNGRVNFLIARDMDLALSARVVDNDYGAAFGRLAERKTGFSADWSWQPNPGATAYAYYGYERLKNRMATINDAFGPTPDPNAGGSFYPLANRWDEESRDDSHTVGLGLRYAFPRAVFETGYAWHYAPYRTSYGFASPGALATPGAAAAAGSGMPDIVYRRQALESSLKFALNRETALRLFYRYERASFDDWHYEGMPLVLGSQAVFLGGGPNGYSAHLVGVFFQYTPGKRDQLAASR
jgi:MtrB/PioB family decaheme-associated outer membrane protein